MFFSDFMQCRL